MSGTYGPDGKVDHIYVNRHYAVRSKRGKASRHLCVADCGERALDWAHIHDTDPDDIWNYQPMCRSCHFKYDKVSFGRTFSAESRQKTSRTLSGRTLSEEHRENIGRGLRRGSDGLR